MKRKFRNTIQNKYTFEYENKETFVLYATSENRAFDAAMRYAEADGRKGEEILLRKTERGVQPL